MFTFVYLSCALCMLESAMQLFYGFYHTAKLSRQSCYWKHFQNGSTGIWDSDNCWTTRLWFSAISTTLENLLIIQSYSLGMIAAFFQASNASLIDSLHDLLSQGTFVVKRQNSDFPVISFAMVFKKLYGRIWRCILPKLSVYIFKQMWLVLKQFQNYS